jgi:hypothetical protein
MKCEEHKSTDPIRRIIRTRGLNPELRAIRLKKVTIESQATSVDFGWLALVRTYKYLEDNFFPRDVRMRTELIVN